MIDTFKKTIEDILEGLNFFDFSFFISGFATFFTLMFFMEVNHQYSVRWGK